MKIEPKTYDLLKLWVNKAEIIHPDFTCGKDEGLWGTVFSILEIGEVVKELKRIEFEQENASEVHLASELLDAAAVLLRTADSVVKRLTPEQRKELIESVGKETRERAFKKC